MGDIAVRRPATLFVVLLAAILLLLAATSVGRATLAADPTITPKSPAVAKLCDQQILDLIASFQYAVVGNLLRVRTLLVALAFLLMLVRCSARF